MILANITNFHIELGGDRLKRIEKSVVLILFVFLLLPLQTALAHGKTEIVFDNAINHLGYIYFDYHPSIYVTLVNAGGEKRPVNITAEVYQGNERLWMKTYQRTIPKDSSEVLSVDTGISQFGIFTLKITADGVCGEKEFSIANRPRDGARNPYLALSDHTASMGHGAREAQRKVELFAKAGFSGLRLFLCLV